MLGLKQMTLALLVFTTMGATAFIKAAIGIGEAVIAVPVLAYLLGIRVAIPLVGLMSLPLVLLLLARNYRDRPVRREGPLHRGPLWNPHRPLFS